MHLDFSTPGTPEYVLHKAGLYDREGNPAVKFWKLLRREPLDEILPPLIELVRVAAAEPVLDMARERMLAAQELKTSFGLTMVQITEIYQLIVKAAAAVGEERRNRPELAR